MTDTTISLRINNEIKGKMDMLEHINWSSLIRRLIIEELKKQEITRREKTKKAIQEIRKIRESGIFDKGKTGVEIIREWRNKRKF